MVTDGTNAVAQENSMSHEYVAENGSAGHIVAAKNDIADVVESSSSVSVDQTLAKASKADILVSPSVAEDVVYAKTVVSQVTAATDGTEAVIKEHKQTKEIEVTTEESAVAGCRFGPGPALATCGEKVTSSVTVTEKCEVVEAMSATDGVTDTEVSTTVAGEVMGRQTTESLTVRPLFAKGYCQHSPHYSTIYILHTALLSSVHHLET